MIATGMSHINSFAYQTGNTEKNASSQSLTRKLTEESQKQFERKIDERKELERKDQALRPQYELDKNQTSLTDIVQDQKDKITYMANGRQGDSELMKGTLINTSA